MTIQRYSEGCNDGIYPDPEGEFCSYDHVVRLQAEVADISENYDLLSQENDRLLAEREVLQSERAKANEAVKVMSETHPQVVEDLLTKLGESNKELAKARELLGQAAGMVNGATGAFHLEIANFLYDHQSTPAAKDEEEDDPCSCCGSRDCNGQCYGDDMMGGD